MNSKLKKYNTIIMVLALVLSILPLAGYSLNAETQILEKDRIYYPADTISIDNDETWIITDDENSISLTAGEYELSDFDYSADSDQWIIYLNDEKSICFASEDAKNRPIGIRCKGGDGSADDPYSFELVYDTASADDQTGTVSPDTNDDDQESEENQTALRSAAPLRAVINPALGQVYTFNQDPLILSGNPDVLFDDHSWSYGEYASGTYTLSLGSYNSNTHTWQIKLKDGSFTTYLYIGYHSQFDGNSKIGGIKCTATPEILNYYRFELAEARTVTFINNNVTYTESTVADGGTVQQPTDPTDSDWTFAGWYLSPVDLNSGPYDFSQPVSQDLTLEAVWTSSFTVKAKDGNGKVGYAAYQDDPVAAKTEDTLTLYRHTDGKRKFIAEANEGFRFVKWINQNDSQISTSASTVYDCTPGGSLTAVFEEDTPLTVTFDPNGGQPGSKWPSDNTEQVSYGQDLDFETFWQRVLDKGFMIAPEDKELSGITIIKTDSSSAFDLDSINPVYTFLADCTIRFEWKDFAPDLTIHFSSVDGDDLVKAIVIKDIVKGSKYEDVVTPDGKKIDEVLFEKEGYADQGFRTPEPISAYNSLFEIVTHNISLQQIINEDTDIYVSMYKLIDKVNVSFKPPVVGESTTTPKTNMGWEWKDQTNKPAISVPDNQGYSPKNGDLLLSYWVETADGTDPFIGTFEQGKEYFMESYLAADYGYCFTEDASADVDGAVLISGKKDPYGDYYFILTTKITPLNKYTITFILNGGIYNGKREYTAEYPEGAVITMPKPSKKGFSFAYWEGSRYYAGDSYTVKEDHTFSAVWKEEPDDADPSPAYVIPKTGIE